jgi:hypothetical protein
MFVVVVKVEVVFIVSGVGRKALVCGMNVEPFA